MAAVVVVIAGGLFALSVASGMLGLGVAFAAVPFLGFFLPDLVHQVQPLSLFLNGVTASVRGVRLRPQPPGGVAAGDPAHHRRRDHGAGGLLAGPVHGAGVAVGLYLIAVGYIAW